MEYSTAIMEDAGAAIEGAAATSAPDIEAGSSKTNERASQRDHRDVEDNNDDRKRKRGFSEPSMQHGSRGPKRPRGDSPGNDKRRQRGDLGRKAYLYVIADNLTNVCHSIRH